MYSAQNTGHIVPFDGLPQLPPEREKVRTLGRFVDRLKFENSANRARLRMQIVGHMRHCGTSRGESTVFTPGVSSLSE